MSEKLEREGIFKARPFKWDVRKADSGAVAISFGFEILAQYDGNGGWIDWVASGADFHCYGDWWVVKKTSQPNIATVEQLVLSLGWDGSLSTVASGACPEKVVQITVKAETYNERTRYKAGWMNPEDYTPGSIGATAEEAQQMDVRFGSLLRAAASAAKAKGDGNGAAGQPPAAPAQEPPPPQEEPPPITDDDIPF